ncbi:MAG: hypothetical protein HYW70_00335 [Candidatus Nealsonbacteria bacterium]|nr:hypothetical protein [Candidatus Nealsonbacteria bacterium]
MIGIGMVVKNKVTEKKGVVVDDPFGCCASFETPVAYEGSTSLFIGTDTKDLKVIGPENAKADLMKCGAGQGKKCCIFLVVGSSGPECQRFGDMRLDIIFRKDKMTAQREPTKLYPNCQLKIDESTTK